jgi:RhtB (resistance to homoserine/threonine) family protein
MEYLPLIISVTFINLIGAISPGPDFVMCVRNSLTYSRRTGIFTGFGIGLGLSVHIGYCAAGLGFLITKSEIAFNIIKFAGAAYLIYMGLSSFIKTTSTTNINNIQKSDDISRLQAMKTGFFTNVLNPKAAVFFIGLFALVIKPETPLWVVIVTSAIMIFTAITWFAFVASIFSRQKIRSYFLKYEKWFGWFFGFLLVALGLKIAFTAF